MIPARVLANSNGVEIKNAICPQAQQILRLSQKDWLCPYKCTKYFSGASDKLRFVAIYLPPFLGDLCEDDPDKKIEVNCFPHLGAGPGRSALGNVDPDKGDWMVCKQRHGDAVVGKPGYDLATRHELDKPTRQPSALEVCNEVAAVKRDETIYKKLHRRWTRTSIAD